MSQPRRGWQVHEFLPRTATRPPEESRRMAAASLRETIRAEGYVLDETTLSAGEPQPVTVRGDTPVDWDGTGEPDGYLIPWRAGATEQGTDPAETLLDPVASDDGALVFKVPQAQQAHGGGVRLRHRLNGEVTVTAFRADGTQTGYLFAADLDEQQVQVEMLPDTARLLVTLDSEEQAP